MFNEDSNFPDWLKEQIKDSPHAIDPALFKLGVAIKNNDVITTELILASKDLYKLATSYQLVKAERQEHIPEALLNDVILLYFVCKAQHPKIIYAILAAGFPPVTLGFLIKTNGDAIAYATFLNILPGFTKDECLVKATFRIPLRYQVGSFYDLKYNVPLNPYKFKFSFTYSNSVTCPEHLILDLDHIKQMRPKNNNNLEVDLTADILDYNQQKFAQYRYWALKILLAAVALFMAGFAYVRLIKEYGKSIPKKQRTRELYDWYENAKVISLCLQLVSFVFISLLGLNYKQARRDKKVADDLADPDKLPQEVKDFDFLQAQQSLPLKIADRFYEQFEQSKPIALLFWSQAFAEREELLKHRAKAKPNDNFCGFDAGFFPKAGLFNT